MDILSLSHWPPSSLLEESWASHGSKYLAKILLHLLQASPSIALSGENILHGLLKNKKPQKVVEFSTHALSTRRIQWKQFVVLFRTMSLGMELDFGAASSADRRWIKAVAVVIWTLNSSTIFFVSTESRLA